MQIVYIEYQEKLLCQDQWHYLDQLIQLCLGIMYWSIQKRMLNLEGNSIAPKTRLRTEQEEIIKIVNKRKFLCYYT